MGLVLGVVTMSASERGVKGGTMGLVMGDSSDGPHQAGQFTNGYVARDCVRVEAQREEICQTLPLCVCHFQRCV